jgi:hypothetical protein
MPMTGRCLEGKLNKSDRPRKHDPVNYSGYYTLVDSVQVENKACLFYSKITEDD